MKKTITKIITALFFMSAHCLLGQELYSPNDYIIQLNESAKNSGVLTEGLLREFNSKSLWTSPDNSIQIWQVQSFPYALPDGTIISTINESVIHSQDKTEIDGASLDYLTMLPNTGLPTSACNQKDYRIYNEQGGNPVRISILDTGISNINDNSQSGFDFSIPEYSGYDYVEEDDEPNDDNGHGSHVAGVIADIVNYSSSNSISYDIRKTHNEYGTGYLTATIRAIYDAVGAGSNVINMSFSHEVNEQVFEGPLKDAINYAEANNVLIVSSAGNTMTNNDAFQPASYPASYNNENIISVASVGCNDDLSTFSNYGFSTVDIAMLGEHIQGPDLGSGIISKDGTSQATAVIAGISAVLGTHQTSFDYQQIKCVLIRHVEIKESLESLLLSEGVVDAEKSLAALMIGECSMNNDEAIAFGRSVEIKGIGLFPNPSHDYVTINLEQFDAKEVSLSVIDIHGRRMIVQRPSNPNEILQIDVRNFPSGQYTIVISADEELSIEKFIKI